MAAKDKAGSAIAETARGVDDRLGSAGFLQRNIRKAFPDHWSFLLGEVALYSFIILILTGIFLTLFFVPSGSDTVYRGTYAPLRGAKVSEAYASTLHISFDVRGGLLMRQIHHWAANIFLAGIAIHLLRIFFTGAFRKPREINWVIGTTLFALALAEGFCGYSLPDDLLSGTGLRIMQGIVLSVPVVGTYLSFFVFGGQFPSPENFIPRLFTLHILLIPGILLALITVHLMIIWHQKHTQWPSKEATKRNVLGNPTFPKFIGQTSAFFVFTFMALVALATWAQINPIWLYGPYDPAKVSAGSQPDWYVGFLEGSLRMMPPWTTNFLGHTIAWNVFLPAVVLPGVFFTLIGFYPFFERWVTGDHRTHHLCDRPRNAATRTAFGMAVIAWYGDLWAAGGNDIIAETFHIELTATTWIFRVGFVLAPVFAFIVTRRLCLYLQRKDLQTVEEGMESGIIKRLPSGEYVEVHEPRDPEAAMIARTVHPEELVAPLPHHVIPLPLPSRLSEQVRARLNHVYTKYQAEVPPTREEREAVAEREKEREALEQ